MSYDWVEGHHPRTRDEIIAIFASASGWWSTPRPVVRLEVSNYIKYVRGQWASWDDCNQCKGLTNLLFAILTMSDLAGVDFCHDDMTVENVVIQDSNGRAIFIDPGISRGLDCREQDEAKLLQSLLTQWEPLVRPKEFPEPFDSKLIPFPVTPAHLALLACHWMRIGAHFKKFNYGVEWAAPHIIKAIRDALRCQPDDECGSIGHRRGLIRLHDRCKRILQDGLSYSGHKPTGSRVP